MAAQEQQWLRESENGQTEPMFSREFSTFAAIATAIIMIAGIIGNALTIFAFWKTQKGNNVTTVFIVCLCGADLLFCLTVLPFNVVRFTVGSSKEEGLSCKLLPFLQYGNVGVSLLFIAMITINRYIMIAHYHAYTKIYRTPFIVAMILFCWIFSFGMQIPALIGIWGKYAYDKRLLSCTILPDANGRSPKTTLYFVGFVIPCLVIIFCYTRIYMVVRSSDSRMRKHAVSNSKLSRKEQKEVKMKRNEWRITKMVLAIFLSFLVCYLPITIIKIADSKVQYFSYHILAYLLLYLSACINPIIYVIMNKQYRQAYKAVLKCHRPKLLPLRRGNTSLADYKEKLTSIWNPRKKPNHFWQSISLVGDYKKLQQNSLQVGHHIKGPTLPIENVTGGSQLEPPIKLNTPELQPELNFSESNPPELKTLGLDFKANFQSNPAIGSRILAGIEVDDAQLKSIKNKLLTNSPTTETEQKIIDFILAEDGFITKDEFRELSRRLRADLLLMYRADLYYEGHPDPEKLVRQEAEMRNRGSMKNRTEMAAEKIEATEENRIFKPCYNDTENEIKSKEVSHCCGFGNCQTGSMKVPESYECGNPINQETETRIANPITKCEPRDTESLTSKCSNSDSRNKSQTFDQNSDNSSNMQKFDLAGKKMILCERSGEGEADVLTFLSDCANDATYFEEPAEWKGFGGNWVGLDTDGRSGSENCEPKQIGYGVMQGFTEKPTSKYPQQLNSVRDCDVISDDTSEKPLNWRGFGSDRTNQIKTHHRSVCNCRLTSLQNGTKYRFTEHEQDFHGEKFCYPSIKASKPSYCDSEAENRIGDSHTQILNFSGFSTPSVPDDLVKFHPYNAFNDSQENLKNLYKAKSAASGNSIGFYTITLSPHSTTGSNKQEEARLYGDVKNPCSQNSRQLLMADATLSNKKKPSTPLPGSTLFESSDDPAAFPYEDLNVMMHPLMFKFQDLPRPLAKSSVSEVESFLQFCALRMTPSICAKIEVETRDQSENSFWFKLKFARVTASILYSVAQCRTPSGYLVKNIMGLRTWFCGNNATLRGRRLETEVAKLVGNRMKTKFHRCGLFLSGAHPILGASPDAINDTYVMEIKSPYKAQSYADYLEDGYKVRKKYMAQIQLQMFMTGRKMGLFCVAAPDFEVSRRVEVISVEYDKELVEGLIQRATKFWKANIFPLLTEIKREADRPPPDYWPL